MRVPMPHSRRIRVALGASVVLGTMALAQAPAALGQAVPGQPTNVAGLTLSVADTAAGVSSPTAEVVVTTEAQGFNTTLAIPPASIDAGSTVTAGTITDAAQQLLDAGVRPPGGMEIVSAIAVTGATGNGLPLPIPFADRTTIRFRLPVGSFPAGAGPLNFEVGEWDGTSWTLLRPSTTIGDDGVATVTERVSDFAPLYAVMYLSSRIAGTPQPANISLLVSLVRMDAPTLLEALTAAGCDVSTFAVLRNDRWRTYIPGAPDAVNQGFPTAAFAQEPFFARCR